MSSDATHDTFEARQAAREAARKLEEAKNVKYGLFLADICGLLRGSALDALEPATCYSLNMRRTVYQKIASLGDQLLLTRDDVVFLRNLYVGPHYEADVLFLIYKYQAYRLGLKGEEASDAALWTAVKSLQGVPAHIARVSDADWSPLRVYEPSAPSAGSGMGATQTSVQRRPLCTVCAKRPLQVAVVGCGHYCACKHCARGGKLVLCPICAVKVRGYMHIRELGPEDAVPAPAPPPPAPQPDRSPAEVAYEDRVL
jgi:hypothetical protein